MAKCTGDHRAGINYRGSRASPTVFERRLTLGDRCDNSRMPHTFVCMRFKGVRSVVRAMMMRVGVQPMDVSVRSGRKRMESRAPSYVASVIEAVHA